MAKALIFDFDGVIVISDLPLLDFLKDMLLRHGIDLPEQELKRKIGLTTKTFLEQILKERHAYHLLGELLEEYHTSYRMHVTDYVLPIESTISFIRSYSGPLSLAIASMSTKEVLEKVLRQYGIRDKFEVIVSREDVTRYKPDPEVYVLVAKRLGVSPQDCVVIEDSVPGVEAALTAGMQCYVVLHELNAKEDFTHLSIAGFIEKEEDFRKLR